MTRLTAAEFRALKARTKSPQSGHGVGVHSPDGARTAREDAARSVLTFTDAAAGEGGSRASRHKYRAKRTPGPDGAGGTMVYDSLKGANLAAKLEMLVCGADIVSFAPEVSFIVGELGGRLIRHRVDMLVVHEVHADGTFRAELIEAKGFDAPAGKRKREALERRLGVRVRVV